MLRHKPTAVIGASTGLFGAVWAQAEVRKTMKASGAHVLDSELPVGMADYAFVEGEDALADPELTQRLHGSACRSRARGECSGRSGSDRPSP